MMAWGLYAANVFLLFITALGDSWQAAFAILAIGFLFAAMVSAIVKAD